VYWRCVFFVKSFGFILMHRETDNNNKKKPSRECFFCFSLYWICKSDLLDTQQEESSPFTSNEGTIICSQRIRVEKQEENATFPQKWQLRCFSNKFSSVDKHVRHLLRDVQSLAASYIDKEQWAKQ
jgi:hypothetical protein